jgi:hypothetical protein
MESFDLLPFLAVGFVAAGLFAVLWEIATKNPQSLLEIATDVRRFALRPLVRSSPGIDRRRNGQGAPKPDSPVWNPHQGLSAYQASVPQPAGGSGRWRMPRPLSLR